MITGRRRPYRTGRKASPGCTLSGMWTFPTDIPIPTTPVDQPYRVHLEAVPGHFQEDTVWVHDHVVVDGRRIVRSASGDGSGMSRTTGSGTTRSREQCSHHTPARTSSAAFGELARRTSSHAADCLKAGHAAHCSPCIAGSPAPHHLGRESPEPVQPCAYVACRPSDTQMRRARGAGRGPFVVPEATAQSRSVTGEGDALALVAAQLANSLRASSEGDRGSAV
jgi:hypothetical protein